MFENLKKGIGVEIFSVCGSMKNEKLGFGMNWKRTEDFRTKFKS